MDIDRSSVLVLASNNHINRWTEETNREKKARGEIGRKNKGTEGGDERYMVWRYFMRTSNRVITMEDMVVWVTIDKMR